VDGALALQQMATAQKMAGDDAAVAGTMSSFWPFGKTPPDIPAYREAN